MMRSATNKVSSVLRIVRGERDALVRTAHFKAAGENVSFATIERKIMSTKTTFKRVALVAVASLGIGVLSSVAPASATVLTAWTVGTNANTSVGINKITLAQVTAAPAVGSPVVVNFGTDIALGDTSTAASARVINRFVGVLTSYPNNASRTITATGNAGGSGTTATFANWVTESNTTGNIIQFESATAGNSGGGARESLTATSTLGLANFSFTPDVAGTYVLTVFNQAGDGGSTASVPDASEVAQTISITVAAAASYNAGLSSLVINNGTFSSSTNATAADLTYAKATFIDAGAVVRVTLKDSNNVALTGLTVGATIAGSGLIKFGAAVPTLVAGTSRSTSIVLSDTNTAYLSITGDNSAGSGVVTFTVTDAAGTTTLGTKTVSFFGTMTAFTRDADTAKKYIGVGDTDTIDLLPVDALGIDAAGFTPVVSSSNTLVATVTANGSNKATVVGVSSGTAEITVCSTTCTTTGVITNKYTVTVTKTTAASFTLTFDKQTYAPGEKMTLTVEAKDSNGSPVADSDVAGNRADKRALFSSAGITANAAITGLPTDTNTITLSGGKHAYTMFAPLISGDVVLSVTEGTGVDSVALLASSAKVITGTATVSGGSADAALDAANEATDAAYAAADAADNATQAAVDAGAAAALAQESADAALAAVTDLGIKVTGLLDKLSASLANIYKIIKAIQAKK